MKIKKIITKGAVAGLFNGLSPLKQNVQSRIH